MKRYAVVTSAMITSAMLFICAAPAHAQTSEDQEVIIPGNPPPVLEEYYGNQDQSDVPASDDSMEGGLGDAADGIGDSGGEATTQSVEEGLEDVEPGVGNDAAVGTGSYVESLAGSEPAVPAEAAEPAEPGTAHDKPSDTYMELPDTGGVPLVGLGSVAAGIVAMTGLLPRSKSRWRLGPAIGMILSRLPVEK